MNMSAPAFPASRVPVVNVASVPQRSPLRYPGGKTWLIPHIREWLRQTEPEILLEPFAGGAIVSLTAVMEDLVTAAFMVEIDRDVGAFWRSALEHGATLQEWICRFEPTIDRLRELEQVPPTTVAEHGFRTLVLNRTRRGGIEPRNVPGRIVWATASRIPRPYSGPQDGPGAHPLGRARPEAALAGGGDGGPESFPIRG